MEVVPDRVQGSGQAADPSHGHVKVLRQLVAASHDDEMPGAERTSARMFVASMVMDPHMIPSSPWSDEYNKDYHPGTKLHRQAAHGRARSLALKAEFDSRFEGNPRQAEPRFSDG